jgi:hypothetical protein
MLMIKGGFLEHLNTGNIFGATSKEMIAQL